MKELSNVSKSLSLLEVKALFDIAMISHSTKYTDHLIRINNIYRFIYDKSYTGLQYQNRYLKDLFETRDQLEGNSSIDIVANDILKVYDTYVNVYRNKTSYTLDDIRNALEVLCTDVKNLILKLFHGETVYTLLLETPVGYSGVYQNTKSLYGQLRTDASQSNFYAFKDYLILKDLSVNNLVEEDAIIDIQGLVFNLYPQFISTASASKLQEVYALNSVRDVKTANGVLDMSTRKCIEEKLAGEDFSLTDIFNAIYKFDSIMFIRRHTDLPAYSVLDWYINFTSNDFKKSLIDVQEQTSGTSINYIHYINTFECSRLVGYSIGSGIGQDFQKKISIANTVMSFIYNTIYTINNVNDFRVELNQLCGLIEKSYMHFTDTRITNGFFEAEEGTIPDYVNLSLMKSNPSFYTKETLDSVNLFLEDDLYSKMSSKESNGSQFLSVKNSYSDDCYVLTPSGWDKLNRFLDLLRKLDEVAEKCKSYGASIEDIITSYYTFMKEYDNGDCKNYTLRGSILNTFNDKLYCYCTDTKENPLFDDKIYKHYVQSYYAIPQKEPLFNWQLQSIYSGRKMISNDMSNRYMQDMQMLSCLNKTEYYRYLEAGLFSLLTIAFPESIDYNRDEGYYSLDINITSTADLSCVAPQFKPLLEYLGVNVGDADLDSIGSFEDFEKMLLDSLSNTIDYDLQKEWFANAISQRFVSVFVLIVLLCNEYISYCSNDYVNTYLGITNKFNKQCWTTVVNNVKAQTFGYRGYWITEILSGLKLGIGMMIVKKLGLNNINRTEIAHYGTSFIQQIKYILSDGDVDFIRLMESSVTIISDKLWNEVKKSIKVNINGLDYHLCFVGVDTILLDGKVYTLDLYDNPVTSKCMLRLIDSDKNVVYEINVDSDSFKINLKLDNYFRELMKSIDSTVLLRYIRSIWEPNVVLLITEYAEKYNIRILPITTSDVWNILVSAFCMEYDKHPLCINGTKLSEPCVTAKAVDLNTSIRDTELGYKRYASEFSLLKRMVHGNDLMVVEKDKEGYSTFYWRFISFDGKSIYNTPFKSEYNQASDIVCLNPILHLLSYWNQSKTLLECYGPVHCVAHLLNTLEHNPKHRYNVSYKKYVRSEIVPSTFIKYDVKNGIKTPIDKLCSDILFCSGTKTPLMHYMGNSSQGTIRKERLYRPIYWTKGESCSKPIQNYCELAFQDQTQSYRDMLLSNHLLNSDRLENLQEVMQEAYTTLDNMVVSLPFETKVSVSDSVDDLKETLKTWFNSKSSELNDFICKNQTKLNMNDLGSFRPVGKTMREEPWFRGNNYCVNSNGWVCYKDGITPRGKLVFGEDTSVKMCGFLYRTDVWIVITLGETETDDVITVRNYGDF